MIEVLMRRLERAVASDIIAGGVYNFRATILCDYMHTMQR